MELDGTRDINQGIISDLFKIGQSIRGQRNIKNGERKGVLIQLNQQLSQLHNQHERNLLNLRKLIKLMFNLIFRLIIKC